jgi:hypothetical protein
LQRDLCCSSVRLLFICKEICVVLLGAFSSFAKRSRIRLKFCPVLVRARRSRVRGCAGAGHLMVCFSIGAFLLGRSSTEGSRRRIVLALGADHRRRDLPLPGAGVQLKCGCFCTFLAGFFYWKTKVCDRRNYVLCFLRASSGVHPYARRPHCTRTQGMGQSSSC